MRYRTAKKIVNKLKEKDKEIERLQSWVNDLQVNSHIICIYCGHRIWKLNNEVFTSMVDVLKEHIEKCPKHPLFEAKQEIEKLNKLLLVEQISNQGKLEEIEQLKKIIEEYANHKPWCDYGHTGLSKKELQALNTNTAKCNCGYYEALKDK